MKLQTKFGLGITTVFAVLAIGTAIMSVSWVNQTTIREAEHRVELYIRSSWEIYNSKPARMLSMLETLATDKEIRALLGDPENESLLRIVRESLEAKREEQDMDILNLLDSEGRIILRTRYPYHSGDIPSGDSLIQQVVLTGESGTGTTVLSEQQLEVEGEGLVDRCRQFGGESEGMLVSSVVPITVSGDLAGIIQMGSLLNGAEEEVDRIRDGVFGNEYYKGKPLGTATVFMGDLRISTNVLDEQGERAVGTRVSREVAQQVLEKGLPWTGRAWVVDSWYLSQYDPIRDPTGDVVGMLYVGELEQRYLDIRTQSIILFLSLVLAGMVLAFVVFFVIARTILGPIENLSVATRRLSSGDLGYRVPVETKDEVGNLSISFNEMAEQMEKQRREIERHRHELQGLNQELETTNRNYMEMLGFVTHELKNPLASAIMSLHTVKGGYLGELNASQKRSLESVASSLDYFSDMIRNYLDLSRLEKGELTANRTHVSLCSEVITPVLERLARGLQEKEMVVKNETPLEMTLETDRDLVEIIYDNLLSNAIKYGREGGEVILAAQRGESEITLSVYNEGEGVPLEKIPLLFKKFSRLDRPEYASKQGTGLGLYICKEIIETQGGRIWAESEQGKWIKFIFTLPRQ
jgi:two-component system NtrC family sensor kinase